MIKPYSPNKPVAAPLSGWVIQHPEYRFPIANCYWSDSCDWEGRRHRWAVTLPTVLVNRESEDYERTYGFKTGWGALSHMKRRVREIGYGDLL